MSLSITRLKREYKELQKNPLRNIRTSPKETNILEWHYVIIGEEKTPYEGGFYHGTVVFPPDYPYKPPTIRMMTPSGRFKPGARLCLSMSDFHPETWNPMWSVGTILMGLMSFMLDSDITNGSIESSEEEKKDLALKSLEFNTTNKMYAELFPDLVERWLEEKKRREETVVAAAEVGEACAESECGVKKGGVQGDDSAQKSPEGGSTTAPGSCTRDEALLAQAVDGVGAMVLDAGAVLAPPAVKGTDSAGSAAAALTPPTPPS